MRDRLGAGAIGLFCLAYGYLALNLEQTATIGLSAAALPAFYATGGVVLCLWLLVRGGKTGERAPAQQLAWGRIAGFILSMSLFAMLVRPLGLILTTTAFLFVGATIMRERRFLLSATVAGLFACLFWALLDRGLGVFIPALPGALSLAT